jgi:hypothetical protein
MSRVSTDYTGRIVDISTAVLTATQVSPSPSRTPLSFGQPTKVIAGVEKTVQAFLTALFTRQGEAWDPAMGCGFLSAVISGNIRTPIDAGNYFSSEVSGILLQINDPDGPDDEYIETAVFLSAVVDHTRISMRIQITTRAGTAVTVLVPIEKRS